MGTHPIFESDFDCLTGRVIIDLMSTDFASWIRHRVTDTGKRGWKLYKAIGSKIPLDPTKGSKLVAFSTQATLSFGMGFGLMTFMNVVEIEGKTKPDGTRRLASYYRLQARRNPEQYLDILRANDVYFELFPREQPKDFSHDYIVEKTKEFSEIMSEPNPYYDIYYANKK